MRNSKLVHSLVALGVSVSISSQADEVSSSKWVGFLTQVEGEVFLLTHRSSSLSGPAPRVKFEGVYFTSEPGRYGSKISEGDVVRTSPSGKARVIYTNGDQLNLGPGSILHLSANSKAPEISLKQGTLRGVIDPQGPMKRLKVRTRSATMGVRGTDFIIEDTLSQNKTLTKVVVLRGKVGLANVAQVAGGASKAAEITAGQAARVEATAATTSPTFQVYSAPKAELKQALDQVKITAPQVSPEKSAEIPEAVKKEIQNLESAAVQVVLADIQRSGGGQIDSMASAETLTLEALDTQVEAQVIEKAPIKSEPIKPDFESLNGSDAGDVYKKYFK